MAAALVDIAPADLDTLTAVCGNSTCTEADSHRSLCECTDCYGEGHGSAHRARIASAARSLLARTTNGFTAAMLAETAEDEAW